MPTARALTTLVHDSIMRVKGELFEFDGELKGVVEEGMEWVTPKSTKKYDAAQAAALEALKADAVKAQSDLDSLKAQLTADPTRADLQQQVLDAESKLADATKLAADATPSDSDLV